MGQGESIIDSGPVGSLCWSGDDMIDWVGGGRRFFLDGTIIQSRVLYSFPFDRAIQSPSGQYAVIYTVLGTKGLVLRDHQVLREVNRSFYHANVYEYPIALAKLRDGQEVLIHCPEEYNRIAVDDLATGDRLTSNQERKPCDFFHSRLSVSPGGRWLISAGWVWHPWSTIAVFDIEEAIRNPRSLDSAAGGPPSSGEIASAAWFDDYRIVVATSSEEPMDDDPEGKCGPNSLTVYDIASNKFCSIATIHEPVGTIFPVDANRVLSLYNHPKLVELATGKVLHRWEHISSGKQEFSIIGPEGLPPPVAWDCRTRRLAVADGKIIRVIQIK